MYEPESFGTVKGLREGLGKQQGAATLAAIAGLQGLSADRRWVTLDYFWGL